jgi:ubiquinone/menaquinone biosynthesis C-methylase UbiE
VLDMGTGTGQVARIAAEMVGPEGAVTAVDASPDALAWAVAAKNSGAPITYVEGDVSSYTPENRSTRSWLGWCCPIRVTRSGRHGTG